MEERIKFFVGLDVRKDTIAVAVAEAGRAPRDPKDELKTGTYHAMLKQLGISEQDLR